MGTAWFRLGDGGEARTFTERALEESRRTNDLEGVRVYEENLRALAAVEGALGGGADDERERRWPERIAESQDLSDAGAYEASNAILYELLAEIDGGRATDPVQELQPLCFVAMPFGVKPDGARGSVDCCARRQT